jgi:REP element-mobilizing transposase RayT
MHLSPAGRIANDFWTEIPRHAPVASLDEFVVMPDHLHGIVTINPGPNYRASGKCERLQVLPGSLGAVIRSFKSATTRAINILMKTPGRKIWIQRYHDFVIHPSSDIETVRNYIRNNPIRWEKKHGPGRM